MGTLAQPGCRNGSEGVLGELIDVIVTCSRCATQFQLDDAKIPTGGARVRCSRCEHAFLVESPAQNEVDHAEDLARDALRGDETGVEDESDWEFNDDGVLAESVGSEELAGDFGPDLEADPNELSTAQDVVDDLLAGFDPSAIALEESSDELGLISDSPLLDEPPLSDEPAPEMEDPLGGLVIGDSEGLEFDPEAEDSSSGFEIESEEAPEAEDLADDPEHWDIFDQPSDSPAEGFPGQQAPIASAARTESGVSAEPRVGPAVAVETKSSESKRWTASFGEIVGWTLVSVLFAVGLVGGLTGRSEGAHEGTGRWSGGGLVADRIEGRWLENAVAGPIYVISGNLHRDSGARVAAGSRLQIQLVDGTGSAIDRAPIWIGPELPHRVLRESSPAEIEALQAHRAADLVAGTIDESSFVAIVADLPDSAERFELQAVVEESEALRF